jgi:hypothetical protein
VVLISLAGEMALKGLDLCLTAWSLGSLLHMYLKKAITKVIRRIDQKLGISKFSPPVILINFKRSLTPLKILIQ